MQVYPPLYSLLNPECQEWLINRLSVLLFLLNDVWRVITQYLRQFFLSSRCTTLSLNSLPRFNMSITEHIFLTLLELVRNLWILQARNLEVVFGSFFSFTPCTQPFTEWNKLLHLDYLSNPFYFFAFLLSSPQSKSPPPFPTPAICLPWLQANSIFIFCSLRDYSWIQIYTSLPRFNHFGGCPLFLR